jgi:autotransporter-associated beta strand protein
VFQLEIVVQDSGYGGLFPRKSTSATLTVNVIDDAPVAVWTGGGADANWSTAANWEANLPAEGMTLRFGAGQQPSSRNDLLTSAGLVTLDLGGFHLSGNPLRLLAGLSSTGDNIWAIDSQLAGPQTFVSPSGRLDIAGDLDTAGHTLTLAADGIIIVNGNITGSGNVIKSGNGAVALAAGNTFSGSTHILGGTLRLTDSAALGGTSSLEVRAGATLDVSALNPPFALAPTQRLFGQGSISGPVVVSGTLEPADPYGVLTFSNAVVLAGTARFHFGPTPAGWTNGLLRVQESLTFGGSLVLTQAAGAFAPGQVLRLFEAAEYRGAFDRFELPALDASLRWDTASLGVDGTLRIGLAPPTLTYRFLPGQGLEIEVPTVSGMNYELQSSDRLTPDAIWERVALVTGGAGPLKVTVPMTPGNPALFLRVLAVP